MLKLNSNTMATWCEELTHMKRPWCWERWKAGGIGDDRGWDGWMASPTQWTWVWVNSWSWWWTGRPGMLQSMGLQSLTWLGDWTELNWTVIFQYQPLMYKLRLIFLRWQQMYFASSSNSTEHESSIQAFGNDYCYLSRPGPLSLSRPAWFPPLVLCAKASQSSVPQSFFLSWPYLKCHSLAFFHSDEC